MAASKKSKDTKKQSMNDEEFMQREQLKAEMFDDHECAYLNDIKIRKKAHGLFVKKIRKAQETFKQQQREKLYAVIKDQDDSRRHTKNLHEKSTVKFLQQQDAEFDDFLHQQFRDDDYAIAQQEKAVDKCINGQIKESKKFTRNLISEFKRILLESYFDIKYKQEKD